VVRADHAVHRDLLEKVTNATVTAYRYYVPAGNNTIVYNRLSSGTNTIAYLTKDHLGSTAVITDSSGNLVVREKYAALGWTENTLQKMTPRPALRAGVSPGRRASTTPALDGET